MMRAARALAGLNQAYWAELARVGRRTIVSVENARAPSEKVNVRRRAALRKIRKGLEDYGIQFTFADQGQVAKEID